MLWYTNVPLALTISIVMLLRRTRPGGDGEYYLVSTLVHAYSMCNEGRIVLQRLTMVVVKVVLFKINTHRDKVWKKYFLLLFEYENIKCTHILLNLRISKKNMNALSPSQSQTYKQYMLIIHIYLFSAVCKTATESCLS